MIVRHAELGDLASIVRVHMVAFDGFFLTRLGPWFLREYYRTVWEDEAGILLVVSMADSARVVGFCVGFVDSAAFYRRLRARRVRLALAALPGLLRRPSLLPRLFSNAERLEGNDRSSGSARDSELASLGVLPAFQGAGIGRALVQAFISQSRALGADRVSLTTDAEQNARVNGFYQSLGFQICETYVAQGNRRMHRYECTLSRADEPVFRRRAA